MISVNDFKTGLTVEVDGDIFTVLDFQHVKPGKGAAFVRSKLKTFATATPLRRRSVQAKRLAAPSSTTVVFSISMPAVKSMSSWTTKLTINSA